MFGTCGISCGCYSADVCDESRKREFKRWIQGVCRWGLGRWGSNRGNGNRNVSGLAIITYGPRGRGQPREPRERAVLR